MAAPPSHASEVLMTVFIDADAKGKLVNWHSRFRQKIKVSTESSVFSTRLGETHALVCGPPDGTPLVCLHGAMASSAHVLLGAPLLASRLRLIAPDIPGHSPMSAEARPDINGPGYAEWLADVFDALKLEHACILGTSWGGLIALRAAALIPHRISKMSLIVPAGIVQGPILESFLKIGWPMMRYRASPSPERLRRFLRYMITTHDEDWEAYLGEAALGYKLDFKPPRLLKEGELNALTAPVQVVAAELDLQSPGRKLIARAKSVIPSLADQILIPQSHHVPPFDESFQKWLTNHLETFLLDLPRA
jgi:2-hydroxy-6-oxonona-2,4-dienedioate hydrolase